MKVLLDTHLVLWLIGQPGRLTAGERSILTSRSTEVFFSAVSIWEIRLKWRSFYASGDRKGSADPVTIQRALAASGIEELPLSAKHAAAELVVALPHKDPFDELLLVQAQEDDLRLLTRDSQLADHPLAMIA